VILLAALAILLSDGRPAFERSGFGSGTASAWRLRCRRGGHYGTVGRLSAALTPVGRFLWMTRISDLPALADVVLGRRSLASFFQP
jgi:lipopolysaccharide/colanic/teichoic acid biosynthesis glycosyltransferase